MIRHFFLTGEKRIGKSTCLKRVLERYAGDADGFLTVRTDMYLKDRYSVHLFRLGAKMVPDENNLLFICGQSDGRISDRFDRLGCDMLSRCANGSVIVMDELGPHEAGAERFHAAVLKLLDGHAPVLGVLQAPADRFWPDIIRRPDVQVIEIDACNRNDDRVVNDILAVLIDRAADGIR